MPFSWPGVRADTIRTAIASSSKPTILADVDIEDQEHEAIDMKSRKADRDAGRSEESEEEKKGTIEVATSTSGPLPNKIDNVSSHKCNSADQ
jgi:hypothetical protein